MHVRNDTLGTRAILLDGEYKWVDPGETVEVEHPDRAVIGPGLVSVPAPLDPSVEIPEVPASLAAKVAKRPQLDHDNDGTEGGSPKPEGDDLPALRAEYKRVIGKRPFNGWDAATLREKIAERNSRSE